MQRLNKVINPVQYVLFFSEFGIAYRYVLAVIEALYCISYLEAVHCVVAGCCLIMKDPYIGDEKRNAHF